MKSEPGVALFSSVSPAYFPGELKSAVDLVQRRKGHELVLVKAGDRQPSDQKLCEIEIEIDMGRVGSRKTEQLSHKRGSGKSSEKRLG